MSPQCPHVPKMCPQCPHPVPTVSPPCPLCVPQLTGGPAAGFLLQALVAATDALSPLMSPLMSPRPPTAVPNVPEAPSSSWICSVVAQPLVAFGCHRLSGDNATANVLLVTSAAVASVALWWPGRVPPCHFVTALTAASLLALAALTGGGTAAVAAALVALGDAVAPAGVPWVRVAASVALLGTMRDMRRR
uniref:Uncharacterized protein n=1 Tax=Taeniopygia guttata TaxID=59729 RepID=A0A674HEM9_TAEGU